MQKARGKPKNIELKAINKELKKKWYWAMSNSTYQFYKKKWYNLLDMIEKIKKYRDKIKENNEWYLVYKTRWWKKSKKQFISSFRDYYKKTKDFRISVQKVLIFEQSWYFTDVFKDFKKQFPETKIISVQMFKKLYEDYTFEEIAKLPISIYWKRLLQDKWYYIIRQDFRYVYSKRELLTILERYKNWYSVAYKSYKYKKLLYLFNLLWEKYIYNYWNKWEVYKNRIKQVEKIKKQIEELSFYEKYKWNKYLEKTIEHWVVYEINELWIKKKININ